MSRSIPDNRAVNPAKKWFAWDSDGKSFKFYDKEAPHPTDSTKKGANISVPLPFRFLVLDTLHTIGGFSDADSSGVYSNEVRDIKKEILNIRIKKNVVASGIYEQVKGKVIGARYAQSVYIGYFDENKELQLGNIKIEGASLGAWINYCKVNKPTEGGIGVKETLYFEKNKKVNWNEPIFEAIKVSSETDAKAMALDAVLQDYLKAYFNNVSSESTPVTDVNVSSEPTPEPTKSIEEMIPEGPAPVTAQNSGLPSDFDDDF